MKQQPEEPCLDGAKICEHIESRVLETGVPLPDILRRAHVAPSTFRSWRSGNRNPSFALLKKVFKALKRAESGRK